MQPLKRRSSSFIRIGRGEDWRAGLEREMTDLKDDSSNQRELNDFRVGHKDSKLGRGDLKLGEMGLKIGQDEEKKVKKMSSFVRLGRGGLMEKYGE